MIRLPAVRWILLLLAVLMPLRAWTGDRMALALLAEPGAAAVSAHAAAHAPSPAAAAQAECHGHGAAVHETAPAQDPAPHPGGHCANCPLCFLVAMPAVAGPAGGAGLPDALPATSVAVYRSIAPAKALKPPIS